MKSRRLPSHLVTALVSAIVAATISSLLSVRPVAGNSRTIVVERLEVRKKGSKAFTVVTHNGLSMTDGSEKISSLFMDSLSLRGAVGRTELSCAEPGPRVYMEGFGHTIELYCQKQGSRGEFKHSDPNKFVGFMATKHLSNIYANHGYVRGDVGDYNKIDLVVAADQSSVEVVNPKGGLARFNATSDGPSVSLNDSSDRNRVSIGSQTSKLEDGTKVTPPPSSIRLKDQNEETQWKAP